MTEYFIDPTYGNDDNAGTEAAPVKTFEGLVAGVGSPWFSDGDRINFKRGETYRETITPPSSGSSDYVIFKDYGTGDLPKISGADNVKGFYAESDLLTNGSFEDWDSTPEPDGWTITTAGTSDITEETSDILYGSSALKFTYDASKNSAYIENTTPLALDDNTQYRFSIWHKEDGFDASNQVAFFSAIIYRTGGSGLDEYLWDTYAPNADAVPVWQEQYIYGIPMTNTGYWEPWEITFDTGTNPDAHTDYYIRLTAFTFPGVNYFASHTFYADGASLGKLATSSTDVITDGSMESWDTADDLNHWTEDVNDTMCYFDQETTDPYDGSFAVKFVIGDVDNQQTIYSTGFSLDLQQTNLGNLGDNTTWRLTFYHKQSDTSKQLQSLAYAIWRDGGVGSPAYDEYLQSDGSWSELPVSGVPVSSTDTDWVKEEVSFGTGANTKYGHNNYHIAFRPYQPDFGYWVYKQGSANTDFYIDKVRLVRSIASSANHVSNASFENWTSGEPDNWTKFSSGDAIAMQDPYRNHQFGNNALLLQPDTDDNDCGVSQVISTLETSTTYRFCMDMCNFDNAAHHDVECEVLLMRDDGYYWDGTNEEWSTDAAVAGSYHNSEYARSTFEFTTPASEQTYTLTLHRAEGTTTVDEPIWIDYVSIVAKDSDSEVYKARLWTEPAAVYMTGTISSSSFTDFQLVDETWSVELEGDHQHPHRYGYTYDRVNKLLCVNIGDTMKEIDVEASVRPTFEMDENSYIKIQNLHLNKSSNHGIDIGYTASLPNQDHFIVDGCTVDYMAHSGILGGYQVDMPYEGQERPDTTPDLKLSPETLTVQDSTIRYWNRARRIRTRTVSTEYLTDPSFEDWDTSDDLAEWTESAAGTSTISRESSDVRHGDYCVRFDIDGSGSVTTIQQDDLGDIFADATTGRFSLWYKTPDWGGGATDDLLSVAIKREDSGGGQGQLYLYNFTTQTGTWGSGGLYDYGTPLPQSTTWNHIEFDFTEGSNPNDYWNYEVTIGLYTFAGSNANCANHTFYIDTASLSNGIMNWYSGFMQPDNGFQLAPGKYLIGNNDYVYTGWSGSVIIQRNTVDGGLPQINYSTGRQGISVMNGGYLFTQPVLIQDNYVTGTDHGIVVIGDGSGSGRVLNFVIRRNYCYETGDDSCWVEGVGYPNLGGTAFFRICYNIFSTSEDEGIDVMHSLNVEIYNNLFHNHGNECITVWGAWGSQIPSSAFIYNNIFYNWRAPWKTLPSSFRTYKPCAIGVSTYNGTTSYPNEDTAECKIDHNIYYSDNDTDYDTNPFQIYGVSKTKTEWLAYGVDGNSIFVDPTILSESDPDFRLPRSSPCMGAGVDLTTVADVITNTAYYLGNPYGSFDYTFTGSSALTDFLDSRSEWPDNVLVSDYDVTWNLGPWAFPVPTIDDDDADFPTDRSLVGVAVYVVDEENHRIWKGVIISNTETTLYIDQWEPVFNAEGYYPPAGALYYVGYIYLYDKTPVYAFINDHWEKNLTEYQMLTNRITTANTIFFKKNLNHGAIQDTDSASMLTDRTSVRIFDGKHRNFQLEHALITNQAIRIKEITYHGVWTRGKYDQ